ncbi:MotA/TolQ/ExbB proton channel family protein [Marivita sp. GX14005]|uniref:MotA/TolQ/ExbB proton channel family protein n=1 Tax=Marivita sp. GX14005 TaxID=2942276 RepID=UPI00201940D7|nr:MotA/TolQ/ExbB proton channel family protein [Marivita sp. GX14005]MCL3883299.1 MotA/TolQ/ExbB proton channel family protein [Marivita sp. GX14005]
MSDAAALPDPRGAAILAGLGAALYWGGLTLGAGGAGVGADTAMGALYLAGALCAAARDDRLRRLAVAFIALAALWAVLAPLSAAVLAGDALPRLSGLRLWPEALSALAGGLALSALSQSDAAGPMDLVFGAALGIAILMALALLWPEAATVLTRSPLHLALTLIAASTMALLLRASLAGLTPRSRRMASGLIALLPLLGFAGTILGIMGALAALPDLFAGGTAGNDTAALGALLGGLSGAFETTLIGLVAAAAASLALTLIETARDG